MRTRWLRIVPAVACCLFVLAGAASAIDMNVVAKDTASAAAEHPPRMQAVIIDSAGSQLYGIVYIAEGAGPHPTVFLLHGFPGNEKMLDLAQVLRRAGFNTVFFGYRGAWGSEGDFSYKNCIEDAVRAVKWIQEPENAKRLRVKADDIIVMGHSMGGFVTMNVAKQLKDVKKYVYFSGWNMGSSITRILAGGAEAKANRLKGLAASAAPLKGTGPEKLFDEMASMKDTHNLLDYVPDLAGKKFLLVGAKRDTSCPMEYDHTPLYEALKKAYPGDVDELVVDDDHVYSATRVEVTEGVLKWLGKLGY